MNAYKDIFTNSHCLSKSQLMAYLNQTLDREEVYTIESHLNTCEFCSAAIDGLMDQPVEETQEALKDLRAQFQQKLHPNAPEIAKPNVTLRSNRNRWMIAASVIGLLGLATLSVYSYLHQGQEHLAMKDKKEGKEGEYKPLPDQHGEVKQITVNPEDIVDSKKNIENLPDNSTEKIKKEEKSEVKFTPPVPQTIRPEEEIKEQKAEDNFKSLDKLETKIPVIEEKAAETENVLKSEYPVGNYKQYESKPVATESTPILISKKSKAGGMENRGNFNNNNNSIPIQQTDNSNYKQIPSNKNVESNVTNETQAAIQAGLKLYQNKKYRRAITTLNEQLSKADEAQKNQINYYLALCFFDSGHVEQAEQYANQVAITSVFGKLATELKTRINLKKNEYHAK